MLPGCFGREGLRAVIWLTTWPRMPGLDGNLHTRLCSLCKVTGTHPAPQCPARATRPTTLSFSRHKEKKAVVAP